MICESRMRMTPDRRALEPTSRRRDPGITHRMYAYMLVMVARAKCENSHKVNDFIENGQPSRCTRLQTRHLLKLSPRGSMLLLAARGRRSVPRGWLEPVRAASGRPRREPRLAW